LKQQRQDPDPGRRDPSYIALAKTDKLSPRIIDIAVTTNIEALFREDHAATRLMTVPGIGPIISTATVAAIGTGDILSKGRDFGAWLGLVPK
jgi:transposase